MGTHPLLQALISGASGVLFGIAIEKGRVFEPQMIRDQMLFKRFAMLKMFLSATSIGMVCFAFLSSMPQTVRRMQEAAKNYRQHIQTKSFSSVAIGGAVLGCGMTIAGACPGTVFVQLGAWVPNAWVTVCGGLCGAFLYALTDGAMTKLFVKRKSMIYFLDRYLGVSFVSLAIPFASVLAIAVFALDYFSPWYTELPESLLGEGIMKTGAWPPFVAGIIVGALQIPIVLANMNTLGTSSSYVSLVSQILPLRAGSSGENYLKQFCSGMKNWWQVFYVGGAVLGGYISASASGTLSTVPGVPWYQAFGGGMMLVYGSRLAGGCTSGYGLSGMGLMVMLSFIAVPAMFGSGMATAFFMRDILKLDI